MGSDDDVKAINARYRAYCDACQSGQLEKVPSYWSIPALFTVDTGEPETLIDSSEVTFYGDRLATIKATLRHMVGSKLHDKQNAIYGCRKVGGEWIFTSHFSVDVTD
jgi:hypothetical protein